MGISHVSTSFLVRSYEVGRLDIVSAGTLLRYLEHIATEASAAAGFSRKWYVDHDSAWVVRQVTLEQVRPISIEDNLAFDTWPSRYARIQAYREYLVANALSGQLVSRAHMHWVYVGRRRGLPTRLPADIPEHAIPDPQEVHFSPLPVIVPLAGEGLHFRMTVQARRAEADTMGHINNSVYMDWLEEAIYEAVESLARDEHIPQTRCYLKRGTLDYMKACVPGEMLVIESSLTGNFVNGLAWKQTISRLNSADTILLAKTLWEWIA